MVLCASFSTAQSWREVEVERVLAPDLVRIASGDTVRLQGLALPTVAVRSPGAKAALVAFLRQAEGQKLWLHAEAESVIGESAAFTGTLHRTKTAPSLNEEALRAGLAVFSARSPGVARLAELREAARTGQKDFKGLWRSQTPPRVETGFLNGAVLGLHYKEPSLDYHRHLDELAGLGFRHVCFLFSAFVQDVESHRIDRKGRRTVTDARLVETIRYARKKGLTVSLLPIVLLRDEGDDEWRGTLRPKAERLWWLEYDAFLCHYLDIAESTGVSMVFIGSEFGSLENRTAAWRRVIANARGRFRGGLTYSVNWDHLHGPQFLNELDAVGVTGYFSLTDEEDPSRAELAKAWRRVGAQVARKLGRVRVPVFISELGYASQNGINTDPWNYYIAVDDVDVQEQADCFAAFLEVASELKWLQGALFYDYFDDGGEGDHTYSPRGKPALELWRQWAAWEN